MSQQGTSHFIFQRGTAVIMIPLVIWFIASVIGHAGDTRAELMSWIAHIWNAVPLGILVLVGFFHMRLGMETVIDDYIQNPNLRSTLQLLNTVFALVMGAIALWSLVAITLIV